MNYCKYITFRIPNTFDIKIETRLLTSLSAEESCSKIVHQLNSTGLYNGSLNSETYLAFVNSDFCPLIFLKNFSVEIIWSID